ncbi:MAG: hypothetical protein K0R47_1864 [Brevibacillus sp.]|jgi:hypothetical protein|nr:hypothetical protein [Brevibacillus sp.]
MVLQRDAVAQVFGKEGGMRFENEHRRQSGTIPNRVPFYAGGTLSDRLDDCLLV